MPGLDPGCVLAMLPGLLAYGPGPGMEFIPYFLGLVAWAGFAFLAVLLSPITALLRRLRRARGAPPTGQPPPTDAEPKNGASDSDLVQPGQVTSESPGDGSGDRA